MLFEWGSCTVLEIAPPVWYLLIAASLVHVFIECRRLKEHPWGIMLMIAVCVWPLGYLFWLFWWPGNLRRWIFRQKPYKRPLPVQINRVG